MTVKNAPYEFLTSPEQGLPGLGLNWLTLAYEGKNANLEQRYLDSSSTGTLQLQRIAVFFGALLMAAFGFMDVIVLEGSLDTIMSVRYGILVPGTLAFLVYTFSSHFLPILFDIHKLLLPLW